MMSKGEAVPELIPSEDTKSGRTSTGEWIPRPLVPLFADEDYHKGVPQINCGCPYCEWWFDGRETDPRIEVEDVKEEDIRNV